MRSNSRQEAYSWLKRQSKKKLIQLMREIGREDDKRSASRKKLLRCI